MRRPPRHAGIDLRIRELVVEGVPRRDAERIARSTRDGLQRLLADRGLPEDVLGGKGDLHMASRSLEVRRSSIPERLGSRVSSAVHGAIRR